MQDASAPTAELARPPQPVHTVPSGNGAAGSSPVKQALAKIRDLKTQLAAAEASSRAGFEPIAVVSMACRFPKSATSPEAFWDDLMGRRFAASEVPADRWDLDAFHDSDPAVPGKMYARYGAFLDSIDSMDPEFFGISPREATWIDPQQRLLMEVGYEAIQRAGWRPETIGPATGIFVGWMHGDYQNEAGDSFLNLNPYIATGAAGSFLCGRLAYALGLEGPSVAIDTACSSSLVALHLACQALHARDCDYALAGGVNAIVSPTTTILTCKLQALSPEGHSAAFDASADGYLRGEGCGVVALKRLADAEADGDTVLGVIRGSAVGHNGQGGGLTVPNPKAQQRVIERAMKLAAVQPGDVGYLEAHGTGTALGDPIEVQAAAAALATGRDADDPLRIGSVKTNIGHLEAAAGMAGLIKVLLSMEHGTIPPQRGFETPNPHIDWDNLPVRVLTEPSPWNGSRRIAGVSAFGMSGTNAHVIVEGVNSAGPTNRLAGSEPPHANGTDASPAELVVLSGRSESVVESLADKLADRLATGDTPSLADIAYTSGAGREHFEHRAAIVATSIDGLRTELAGLAHGVASASGGGLASGKAKSRVKVGWQFTGQGSQYAEMGRELYRTQPVFAEAIDRCDDWLRTWRTESLRDVLFDADSSRLDHTSWTQPAIYAVQMGLVHWLRDLGYEPDVVLGHSVGQYAAAATAGVFSWEEGLRLIAERGRLIGSLPAGGRMLAVFATPESITERIGPLPESISLAALNGTHVVLSGPAEPLESIADRLKSEGVRCRMLATSHAFHSSQMDSILEPFAAFADQTAFASAAIPLVCNVTGQMLPADASFDGDYWAKHIREAVQYAPSVAAAAEHADVLLEIGPQGILTRMAAAVWEKPTGSLISLLDRGTVDRTATLTALAKLYTAGATPAFDRLHAGRDVRIAPLPTYPFERRRFWGPAKPSAFEATAATAHPLLGGKVSLAGLAGETRYESFLETDSPAWLPDHEVMGSVVLPGAGYVEMALAAAGVGQVEDIQFEQPLRPVGRTAMQTIVRASGESASIETYSAPANGGEWVRHFSATLTSPTGAEVAKRPAAIDRDAVAAACERTAEPAAFYEKMNEVGLAYGPAFQVIDSLAFGADDVLAHLTVQGDVPGYTIAPTLLDGALHSLAVGLLAEDDGNLFLPVGIQAVRCFATIEREAWCHARWVEREGPVRTADITLFSADGQVLASIEGLSVRAVSRAALRQMSGAGAERLLYDIAWKPTRLPAIDTTPRSWLLIGDEETAYRDRLAAQGQTVVSVTLSDEGFARHEDDRFTLDSSQPENWGRLFADLSDETTEFAPDGIAWLVANDSSIATITPGMQATCEGTIHLTQTLLDRGIRRLHCGWQFVTAGGIDTADEGANPSASMSWGLGRVLGAEQPEFRVRLVDHPAEPTGDTIDEAVTLFLTDTRENQFAIRDGRFLVPTLRQAAAKKPQPVPVRSDAAYLITGGLGGLGRLAAKWLSDQGAGQIVLVSRRQPSDEVQAELDALDAEIIVHSADLSRRDDVTALLDRFGSDRLPLAGLIHAAGVLDDALITDQSWERFEKVLAPKIIGAGLLHELTQQQTLDFFVLYSSVASVLGSPGQSNYATANAYLDGLAAMRRASGLPCTVLNWGPWTVGMADDERLAKRLALQGITPLTPDESHEAMAAAIGSGLTQATVLDVDWHKLAGTLGKSSPALLDVVAPAKSKQARGESELVKTLKTLSGSPRRDLLLSEVQGMVQRILSADEPPVLDRPLTDLGLDSLMAVEFGTELSAMLGDGYPVGPTMLFDHPSIDAITDHVLTLLDADESPEPEAAAAQPAGTDEATAAVATREPIAIIGMACRFPGARNTDEFWDNLIGGVDSVREIPPGRWDVDRFYSETPAPGKMTTKQGGFLDDIDQFDAEFFNLSPEEACWTDPQHRMLLENSYLALEDAGIDPSHNPTGRGDSSVGVFMGIMGQDYAFLPALDDERMIATFEGAGLSHSAGVGRISYSFGFEGPAVAVDTASSSSLVAVYQAVRSLQEGRCHMALAGGVNAILAPCNSLLLSKASLLAPDGRSKSFSAAADGFGRGEGCGVVVLKRLSDAEANGDNILAVIRGGAVVHNGYSSGITAPNGKSQTRAIEEALSEAKLAPSQVQYLEAHGTGTEFGDPIELMAAAGVYGRGRKKTDPLLLGSVKANIGHLEAAGGMSGLIKTVLCLRHGTLPPQLHFEEPSKHIPWRRLPVRVVTEPTPWPDGARRTAGVTAIGLVGTNAHLVLSADDDRPADVPPTENALPPEIDASGEAESNATSVETVDAVAEPMPCNGPLVLSARSEAALADLVAAYRAFLPGQTDADWAAICRTAATGRRHYEHRIAVAASSPADAAEALASAVGREATSGLHTVWTFESAAPATESLRRELATHPLAAGLLAALDRTAFDDDSPSARYGVQAAIASLAIAWGMEPDLVAGRGWGQFAAGVAAGAMDAVTGAKVVTAAETALQAITNGDARDDALSAFESSIDSLDFYPPSRPLVCGLEGTLIPVHRALGGSYWRAVLAAVIDETPPPEGWGQTIAESGAGHLPVELGEGFAVGSQPVQSVAEWVGVLFTAGLTPNFAAMMPPARKIRLPHYPFQKRRFWITQLLSEAGHETTGKESFR